MTVVALELLRRRVADDTERRLAGDVLSGDGLRRAGRAPSWRAGSSRSGSRDRVGVARARARRARSGGAVEAALGAALRDEALGGLVAPAPAASLRAAPARRVAVDDELFALAERVRGAGRASRPALVAGAGAGRAVPAGELRRELPRGALRARGARADARATAAPTGRSRSPLPTRLATYRDLGSFQLLLSLQDDDALRLFCDSILGPIEDGEGAYGGELMRSLEAFIECNGQWERGGAPALLPPPHAALPDPPGRGADRAATWTRRATGSTSGSRCAAASSFRPPPPTHGD